MGNETFRTITVSSSDNFCMSAIIKKNYGVNYGEENYYKIADKIIENNQNIFNSGRGTVNNSGKSDETILYTGDAIILPDFDNIDNIENIEPIKEDYSFKEENSTNCAEENFSNYTVKNGDYLWKIANANTQANSNTIDTMINIVLANPQKYGEINETVLRKFASKDWDNLAKQFPNKAGEILLIPNSETNIKQEDTAKNTDTEIINLISEAQEEYQENEIKEEELQEKTPEEIGKELLEAAGIDVDFKIGDSKQKVVNGIGIDGDCWLLTGLNTLSYTQKGAQMIKDAMSINADGSIDIHFNGIDETFNVTLDEMKEYNETRFSGDDDVMAFEIATLKFRQGLMDGKTYGNDYSLNYYDETKGKDKAIWSGWAKTVWELFMNVDLTGKKVDSEDLANALDFCQNAKESLMSLGVSDKADTGGVSVKYIENSDGQSIKFYRNHAYAVKDINDDIVTIVDPLDSLKEIKITRETLYQIADEESVKLDYCRFKEKSSSI